VVTVTINGANDAAVITGALSGTAIEDSGITITGTLTATDVDLADPDGWNASALASTSSGKGSYSIDAAGKWTYAVDNTNSIVNALNVGGTTTDTFTVTTPGGDSRTVTVTIQGTNDLPVVIGTSAGTVQEAGSAQVGSVINVLPGTPSVTGTVTYTDVDNSGPYNWGVVSNPALSIGQFGTYTVTAGGQWTYNLNNANGLVQGLKGSATLNDTFALVTVDGTTQTISINITGQNDVPVITGPTTGTVLEAGGVSAGTPTATGNLDAVDVDDTSDIWQSVGTATTSANGYGTYTLGANGAWTYTLDNSNATVQALNNTQSTTDFFTVLTLDGTSQTVVVTINGQNDPAIIAPGNDAGSVTEGVNGALGTTATANLNATDVDNTTPNTSGDNWTVVQNPITTASGKGSYSIDGTGQWTYTINETNATVNALNAGQNTSDSFTVTTVDGTSKTVNVIINGANDAAVITGPITGTVSEANGSIAPGTPTATGNLNFTDVDNVSNNDVWQAVNVPAVSSNLYGTYTIDAAGVWTYELNNLNGNVQQLQNGQSLSDSFVVTTFDGTTQSVSVLINGINDTAIISGAIAGTLTESTASTTGNLTSVDVDNTSDVWQVVTTATASAGGYGTYTIDADGVWTYNLNTSNVAVDGLNVNQTLTDTFTVKTVDGLTPANGTPQVVTITITGQNDVAIITSAGSQALGSVIEAGGLANAISGTPTATGDLDSTDVDAGQNDKWAVITTPSTNNGTYGKYSIGSNGLWTYTVDNANAAVQGLNAGQSITDTFVATTIDSSASQTVTVTINGVNDTATILNGAASGSVIEAGGLSNATPGTTATANLNSNDVDNGQNDKWTVVTTPSANNTTYGKYTIDSAGVWNYAADETNSAVQALNLGTSITDTFVAYTIDNSASQTVTVTINGTNDTAVITSTAPAALGSVIEAGGLANAISGTPTATGDLNSTDVDAGQNDKWSVIGVPVTNNGAYGKYSISSTGAWTYTVDNANGSVQALNVGTSITDTFVAYTIDGTASQTVTVTINGANDTAVISNFTGTATEAGGTSNGTPGTTASGTLTISDPDDTYPGWSTSSTAGTYGNYTLNAAGAWTYTLSDSSSATQALTVGQTVTDTFTAVNGSLSQVVTVTVTGTNDNPILSGSAASLGPVAENSPYTITTAQLLQGFSDVDAGQTATLSIANLTSPQGTFTLSGATYTFVPTNLDYNGVVNLVYNVKDASNGVYAATSSFTITPVNDAPTALSTTASLASVDEDTTNPAGATVLSLFGSTFSDAKDNPPNAFAGVAITTVTSNSGQGLWQWLDVNNAWQAISSVSTSGALFLNTATKIRFLPVGDFNGVPGSIEARLVEPGALNLVGNPVTTGDLTNVSGLNSGGTTHVSNLANTVVLSTSINPIDDPTTITGNTSGTVTEDTAISFLGSLVATDPDVSGPLFISVTNQDGANNYGKFTILNNGTWQYNLDNNNPLVQHLGAANSLNDTYTFNTITGASQTVSVTINGTVDAGVSITGTSANEVINGKDGSDFLSGGDGNDSLIGGFGNDYLIGGNGNDTLNAGDDDDLLRDDQGDDYLIGGRGDDDLYAGIGSNTLEGGAGNDRYYISHNPTDTVNSTIVEAIGGGIDIAYSSLTVDALADNVENLVLLFDGTINATGNALSNGIHGNSANNVINGGGGDDYLNGHLGNDYLIGGNGSDVLDGEDGDDLLRDDQGDDYLIGGRGDDDLYAGIGSNTLEGGAGNDRYYISHNATDTVNSIIIEEAGAIGGIDIAYSSLTVDRLADNVENLALLFNGAINATGNSLGNVIYGNSASNVINGGAGADIIIGGAGADIFTFAFTESSATSNDRIVDFEIGTDKIDLLSAPAGVAATPTSFIRAADDSSSTNLSTLVQGVYGQGLGLGGAALVISTGAGLAGNYLVIDDGIAGFGSGDLVINITGAAGALPTTSAGVRSLFKTPAVD
jgi:VCBS repeat-containing protein